MSKKVKNLKAGSVCESTPEGFAVDEKFLKSLIQETCAEFTGKKKQEMNTIYTSDKQGILYLVGDTWNGMRNENDAHIVGIVDDKSIMDKYVAEREKIRQERLKETCQCKKCIYASVMPKDFVDIAEDGTAKYKPNLPVCFCALTHEMRKQIGTPDFGKTQPDEIFECINFKNEKDYVPNQYEIEEVQINQLKIPKTCITEEK